MTDLRISCSSEVNATLPTGKGAAIVKSERIKERTSFDFQWMRLDMTVTKSDKENQLNYEVELEVKGIEFWIQHARNEQVF